MTHRVYLDKVRCPGFLHFAVEKGTGIEALNAVIYKWNIANRVDIPQLSKG